MRLYNHLSENVRTFEEAVEMIQKHCKPFLKEWLPIFKKDNEAYLYRGSTTMSNSYGTKTPRTDRIPRDTNTELSYDIDNAFYSKFKIKGRSETIFVTAKELDALSYGHLFMIFPMYNYKYLWSRIFKYIHYLTSSSYILFISLTYDLIPSSIS